MYLVFIPKTIVVSLALSNKKPGKKERGRKEARTEGRKEKEGGRERESGRTKGASPQELSSDNPEQDTIPSSSSLIGSIDSWLSGLCVDKEITLDLDKEKVLG